MADENEEMPWIKWQQGNVRVIYESMDVDMQATDGWPPYLATVPRVGDMVESTKGRRLQIKEVVHALDGNKAALKIVIGRDLGGSTPTDGGATDTDW